MSGESSDDSDAEVSDEKKVPEPDVFGKFYFDQIQLLRSGSSSSLASDVQLVCEGNQIVSAHKFVLHFASQFFSASAEGMK